MSFSELLLQPIEELNANLSSVIALLDFDRLVLEHSIQTLTKLEADLSDQTLHNAVQTVSNARQALENIRTNDSLKLQYQTIVDQCVVLQVSHFATALKNFYTECILFALVNEKSDQLGEEEIKVTVKALCEISENDRTRIAELVVSKHNMSFQDMKQVYRAFKTYFGHEISKTTDVTNIICGQAARHAIVHNGGRTSPRTLAMLEKVEPQDIQLPTTVNQPLGLKKSHVHALRKSMLSYMRQLQGSILDIWNV